MHSKTFLAAALLALALPFSAMADPENKAEHLVEALNLQGDRANQVQQILEDHYDQVKEIKKRAHEDMKQLKEEKMQNLQQVLTEQEMNQLEAIKKLTKGHKRKHDKDDDDD